MNYRKTIVVIILILVTILVIRPHCIQLIGQESQKAETSVKRINGKLGESFNPTPENKNKEQYNYQLTPITPSYTPTIRDKVLKKNAKYRFYGGGGLGKILDEDNKVVVESNVENEDYLFHINLSPDQNKILIYRGSTNYDILDSVNGALENLPQRPPQKNMLGFHSWDWLDNFNLIGVAYKLHPKDFSGNHETSNCGCGDPSLAGSAVYTYDLRTGEVAAVELPDNLQNKNISINQIDVKGKIQLQAREHIEHEQPLSSWFGIELKN